MQVDPGSRVHFDEYRQRIQAQLELIAEFIETPHPFQSAEQLEALECEVRQLTDQLGSLVIGHHLPQTLSAEALREAETALVSAWPKRLSSDGLVTVAVRTAQGLICEVQARYFRQKGRAGSKRGRGVYPGLVLLGIPQRCTPGLASEVSQLAALLGSLEEARGVLEAVRKPLASLI